MTADVVIEVSGLRISYGGVEAVQGIDLRVSRGEIFTFLSQGVRPGHDSVRALRVPIC